MIKIKFLIIIMALFTTLFTNGQAVIQYNFENQVTTEYIWEDSIYSIRVRIRYYSEIQYGNDSFSYFDWDTLKPDLRLIQDSICMKSANDSIKSEYPSKIYSYLKIYVKDSTAYLQYVNKPTRKVCEEKLYSLKKKDTFELMSLSWLLTDNSYYKNGLCYLNNRDTILTINNEKYECYIYSWYLSTYDGLNYLKAKSTFYVDKISFIILSKEKLTSVRTNSGRGYIIKTKTRLVNKFIKQ